jgi:cleavage stimulation factor subunit 2
VKHLTSFIKQAGPSMPSGVSQLFSKEGDRPSNALEDWAKSSSKYSNVSFGVENTGMVHDNPESFTRPSKLTRLNDGRGLSAGTSDVPVSNGSSHVLGSSSLPVPVVPKADVRHSDQQSSQVCRAT